MRIHYWQYLLDSQGNPINEADVRIYLSGTAVEADVFTNASFGASTKSSQIPLQTNSNGFFQVWFGDIFETEGGYESTQKFDVEWTKGSYSEKIESLSVYAPFTSVDQSDTDTTKNKTTSNWLSYKINNHVNSDLPSAAPHNINPYKPYEDITNTKYNKVISNRLGYQMYELALSASTLGLDTSAARTYEETIPSGSDITPSAGYWIPSGGIYYKDIVHNFSNKYPLVRVARENNKVVINPYKIKTIDRNTIRIYSQYRFGKKIIVIG